MSRDPDRRTDRWMPWPADRPPSALELLEFARVNRTSDALPVLESLLRHAAHGRSCIQGDHDAGMSRLDEISSRLNRALVAHASARNRASHWRAIAVELATASEGRRLELAAGALALDAGRSFDRVDHITVGAAEPFRTTTTVDLLGTDPEADHACRFVPAPDGRLDGKPRFSNRCSCGAWQHPLEDHVS